MTSDHLKFAPDILRRLGEELNPDPIQGIIEMVHNAYDADAHHCTVELKNVKQAGGVVRICDDGVGMDIDAIRNGWLVIGRSVKQERRITDKFRRYKVGLKGLGRLSALRMGTTATLVTCPGTGVSHSLGIDWTDFDDAKTIEQVSLHIDTQRSASKLGTVIEISNLKTLLTQRDVRKLVRSLLLVTGPFGDDKTFTTKIVAPEFDGVVDQLEASYFGEAEYRLVAELDQAGYASAAVYDYLGKEIFQTKSLSKAPYKSPCAKFELWVFILDAQTFSTRKSTKSEVQKWLKEFGGVYLYRRGLRVFPYGDPGHDWLEMNLARSRSPEKRPSTNTSIGRVSVQDPDEKLFPKTDRSGFIETEAFLELRRFAKDALNWMSYEQLRIRDRQRQSDRIETSPLVAQAQTIVDKSIVQLPLEVRPQITEAFFKLQDAQQRETRALREEIQLYRTLATLGTTAGVFAHESLQPIAQIERAAANIREIAKGDIGLFDRDELSQLTDLVERSAFGLNTFANLLLEFVKRDKRRIGRIDIHQVITKMHETFVPFYQEYRIVARLDLASSADPFLLGSQAAIEAIFANLLTNAIYVLSNSAASSLKREILIQTSIDRMSILIRICDSGPGLTDLDPEEIWLPGKTSKKEGTGLGLTIVKDSVLDLQGQVCVVSPGELGGAEFQVNLPLIGTGK